jgi:hypothetical protein
MRLLTRIAWPIVIVCSALAALLVMLVYPGVVVRPLLIMWFLFICPGMAFVRFFRLKEVEVKLPLAVALSFSIDGIVAGVYLYANHWSPWDIMLTLTMGSIAAVVVELTNIHVLVYQHIGFVRRLGALLTHPLIIGTNPVTPQLAGVVGTIQNISESPTVLMPVSNSISRLSADVARVGIDEAPTVQLANVNAVTPVRGERNGDVAPVNVDIDEKPTTQMANMTVPASLRVEEESGLPSLSAQARSSESQHREGISGGVDVTQTATVELASVKAVGEETKNPDPFRSGLSQQQSNSERRHADEHDIENTPTRQLPMPQSQNNRR